MDIQMKIFIHIWLVFLIISKCCVESNDDEDDDEDDNDDHDNEWVKTLIPDNYSRRYLPPLRSKSHSYVMLLIIPSVITSVVVKSMEFGSENNFQVYWFDPRLKPSNNKSKTKIAKLKGAPIKLPSELLMQLWTPDLEFTNCKKCEPALINEKTQLFLYLPAEKGSYLVAYYRKTMVFVCTFDLKQYPFDIQRCSMNIEMDSENVTLKIQVAPDADGKIEIPPEYKLLSHDVANCEIDSRNLQTVTTNDPNSGPSKIKRKQCYKVVFRMRRNINSFIILIFIPSGLIIIISWLSFWLDPQVAAPRVALGLTSILTLATQFNNVQKDLPPVAYIKAIDVWMFFCLFFVFASLVEFTGANYYARMKKQQNNNQIQPMVINNLCKYQISNKKRLRKERFKKLLSLLRCGTKNPDHVAKILFPLTFLIFNTAYWSNYITKYYEV